MSYRYSSFDIIVGVGLCAIVFGAMLFFVATTGMFLVGGPHTAEGDGAFPSTESAWLQPALGKAIVEQALLQLRTDRITVSAASEWTQALQSHRSLLSRIDDPLASVVGRAKELPKEHEARVQGVLGRSVVNFTQRGIRGGMLSADLYLSDYNQAMINAAEERGKRMHDAFASTWQSRLGTWIVDTSREHVRQVAAVQEQLGGAIMHVTQARMVLDEAWSANQYQLGSLMAALDRSGAMNESVAPTVASDIRQPVAMASAARMPGIPDIPMGYLMAAALALCSIFFAGVVLSAAAREAKALAEARRNTGKWVYRMAS
jgi:hypothetical protein